MSVFLDFVFPGTGVLVNRDQARINGIMLMILFSFLYGLSYFLLTVRFSFPAAITEKALLKVALLPAAAILTFSAISLKRLIEWKSTGDRYGT